MVRGMDPEGATEYMRIKMTEVRVRAREAGIAQFIDDKSFRPTYEPARRRYFERAGDEGEPT